MPLTVEIADSPEPYIHTIEQTLGQGAQGRVYQCSEEDGRKVAVKITRETDIPELYLKILPMLDHPNIVPCKATKSGNFFLLEMPVLEQTLEDMIHERKNSTDHWSWSMDTNGFVLRYLRAVADALKYLYGIGNFVHKDIKPKNIMLDKKTPKIIDFGCLTTCDSGTADVQGVALVGIFMVWFKERRDVQKQAMLHFPGPVEPEPDDLFSPDLVVHEMFQSYEKTSKVLIGCTEDFHSILTASYSLKVYVDGETVPFSICLLLDKLKQCTKLTYGT